MGNPLICLRKENVFMGNYLSGITLNGEYMNKHRTVLVRRAVVSHTNTHHLLLDTRNGQASNYTNHQTHFIHIYSKI